MTDFSFNIPETWMFVPAAERFLKDLSRLSTADVLIFDLEDSLKEEKKAEGLSLLKKLDVRQKSPGAKWIARINKDRAEEELKALYDSCLDGFMFPKMEDPRELDGYADLIRDRYVAALIETPAGVAAIDALSSDERIAAFAFGAEDFCACLNTRTNPSAVAYARGRIVLYCALNKKTSIDMVSSGVKDKDVFSGDLEDSMNTGFCGKLLIHPAQLKVVDDLKSGIPKDEIRSIIERYETDPSGSLLINGRLFERMHAERLKRLL